MGTGAGIRRMTSSAPFPATGSPRRCAVCLLLASAVTLGGCGDGAPVPGGAAGAFPGNDAAYSSLPDVASGRRPGPELLYAPPVRAPQLDNVALWTAEPILVSGAWAYRQGEFVYQDFLYDDRGAAGVPDPSDPFKGGDYLYGPKTGTLTYPTDPVFANNAADLVELRLRPLADATALRVTLNTLQDAERTAFTVAIGDSAQARDWPHGAGVRSPAALFLTVHGATAELRDAATGALLEPAPQVMIDPLRRQFTVRVAHVAWNPGREKVRVAAGVGLWDAAAARYLAPQLMATERIPGGAAASGAALYNLAFRFDEPTPDWNLMGASLTLGDAAVAAKLDGTWWRERAQAEALRTGDISAFFADVDFARLADGVADESGIPHSGPISRILASRFETAQGVDYTKKCGRFPRVCDGAYTGQLQPYMVYVSARAVPSNGWGLTLLLHAWSANYNLYLGSRLQSQLGERGAGSLVVTPSARGSDGDYHDIAEADLFETWADVARNYPLDPDWVSLAGFSMGGGGTFHMLTRWPDLFAGGMSVGAVPQEAQGGWSEAFRHTPVMVWIASLDEGTPFDLADAARSKLGTLGLRFVFDYFLAADHLTLFTNDEWTPVADFLGERRVVRDPAHVTYVVDPRWDSARAGMIADHAYWLSALRLRDTAEGQTGMIDARSDAAGVGDAPALGVVTDVGALSGGYHGPMPYQEHRQDWGDAPLSVPADRLVLQARNIANVTIDVTRAGLSCDPQIAVTTDGPMTLQLDPCGRLVHADVR